MDINKIRYGGFETDVSDVDIKLGKLPKELGHKLRIATWNINGIRSGCIGDPEMKSNAEISKKLTKCTKLSPSKLEAMDELELAINSMAGLNTVLEKSDIICVQETRIDRAIIEKVKIVHEGHLWRFIASSSTNPLKNRRGNGYSGTAILIKDTIKEPKAVYIKFPNMKYQEGRFIHIEWDDFNLVNVYVPNSGTNIEYRRDIWHPKFLEYVNTLKNLVICGDFNVARTVYDLSRSEKYPDADMYSLEREIASEKQNSAGFMNYERDWIEKFINDNNYVDVWRSLYPNKKNEGYTYKANLARSYWRIDYFFIKMPEEDYLIEEAEVLQHNKSYSDHIPLIVNLYVNYDIFN